MIRDPIIYLKVAFNEDNPPGWYFYREDWATLDGPYPSEDAAQKACLAYGRWLIQDPDEYCSIGEGQIA
jgi:hypothetical protein